MNREDDTAVRLLKEMICIESHTGNEYTLAKALSERMEQLGFNSAYLDEVNNVIGERGDGERVISLVGHLDTVRGSIPVQERENKIFGRGAVDAKGSLAAMIMAVSRIKETNNKRFVVAGVVKEEHYSSEGAFALAKKYRPDYAIIGEPSGVSSVTIGYKGKMTLFYEAKNRNKHSSSGDGSIEEALSFWREIKEYAEVFNNGKTLFRSLQASARDIQFTEDWAENRTSLFMDMRTPPSFDSAAFEEFIQSVKGKGEVRITNEAAAFEAEKNNGLIRAFLNALRRFHLNPRFKLKSGTCDMNHLGPIWNVPIVSYGPGDSNLCHSPDEHIDIDDYLKSIEILKTVLESL